MIACSDRGLADVVTVGLGEGVYRSPAGAVAGNDVSNVEGGANPATVWGDDPLHDPRRDADHP